MSRSRSLLHMGNLVQKLCNRFTCKGQKAPVLAFSIFLFRQEQDKTLMRQFMLNKTKRRREKDDILKALGDAQCYNSGLCETSYMKSFLERNK